ncbi:MAG: hypothetical protein J0H42_32605 [Rhizobiales bacterium]|nr:hypothetical protein [Hyphomicrobiales bacterium]
MKKFWMMSGTVIAVSVTVMVWNLGPVRSSENLLVKAQSEFAAKARDALIQRQMAQVTTAPPAMTAPKTEAPSPHVVAAVEPVAAPTVAPRETRFEAPVPAPEPQAAVEPQTVPVASVEAPIAAPEVVSAPTAPSAPAAEDTPAPKMQLAALPAEPQSSVLPKQIAVAPVSEVAKAETPAVTPPQAEPRRQFKAERKPRHVQRERRTNDGYRSDRYDRSDRYERTERVERRTPRYLSPYNLDTLRARSPELAAAIARYM